MDVAHSAPCLGPAARLTSTPAYTGIGAAKDSFVADGEVRAQRPGGFKFSLASFDLAQGVMALHDHASSLRQGGGGFQSLVFWVAGEHQARAQRARLRFAHAFGTFMQEAHALLQPRTGATMLPQNAHAEGVRTARKRSASVRRVLYCAGAVTGLSCARFPRRGLCGR